MNIRTTLSAATLLLAMTATAHAAYFYDLSDTLTIDLDRVSSVTYDRHARQNAPDYFEIDVRLADGTTQAVIFELDHEADAKKAWHDLRTKMQDLNIRK